MICESTFRKSQCVYILKVNSIHYTFTHAIQIHLDTLYICFPLEKISGTKKGSFFSRDVQLSTVLLLFCDSHMCWSTRFVSLKLRVDFSIFYSVAFLQKLVYIFSSTKFMDCVTLKRHKLFQNKKIKRKATHSFLPRPLIFKLQQKVLNSNNISLCWNSPKSDLMTNFLNLEYQSLIQKTVLLNSYSARSKTQKPRKARKGRNFVSDFFSSDFLILT